jgi:hypothetical protein
MTRTAQDGKIQQEPTEETEKEIRTSVFSVCFC